MASKRNSGLCRSVTDDADGGADGAGGGLLWPFPRKCRSQNRTSYPALHTGCYWFVVDLH